jgi:hypothetical protein
LSSTTVRELVRENALGKRARAHADGFAAVRAQRRARAEIVVVDAVMILLTLGGVQHHGQGHARVQLALKVVVIDAVVSAVEGDPVIGDGAIGLVETVDHRLGDPRVVGQGVAVAAERDDLGGRTVAVLKGQAGHDQMATGQAQIRLAGDDDLARRLGAQGDRSGRRPFPREHQLDIAPTAIG